MTATSSSTPPSLTGAGVIWPASRRAKTLDCTVPDVFELALFEKYGTPELLEDARATGKE